MIYNFYQKTDELTFIQGAIFILFLHDQIFISINFRHGKHFLKHKRNSFRYAIDKTYKTRDNEVCFENVPGSKG